MIRINLLGTREPGGVGPILDPLGGGDATQRKGVLAGIAILGIAIGAIAFQWLGSTRAINQLDEEINQLTQEKTRLAPIIIQVEEYQAKLLELEEKEREKYLKAIIGGESFVDKGMLLKLQTAYKMLRLRILTVYYQNFPENRVPKDARGVPTTQDLHQISNPNTRELVTGWDVANYPGPVTWEEEERLRARMKNILWEGD